jgi:hypothetical protein
MTQDWAGQDVPRPALWRGIRLVPRMAGNSSSVQIKVGLPDLNLWLPRRTLTEGIADQGQLHTAELHPPTDQNRHHQ